MRRTAPRIAIVLLVALIGVVGSGCYRHVIRTEGLGAGNEDIYEPNSPDPDEIDDVLWGGPNRKKRKR